MRWLWFSLDWWSHDNFIVQAWFRWCVSIFCSQKKCKGYNDMIWAQTEHTSWKSMWIQIEYYFSRSMIGSETQKSKCTEGLKCRNNLKFAFFPRCESIIKEQESLPIRCVPTAQQQGRAVNDNPWGRLWTEWQTRLKTLPFVIASNVYLAFHTGFPLSVRDTWVCYYGNHPSLLWRRSLSTAKRSIQSLVLSIL